MPFTKYASFKAGKSHAKSAMMTEESKEAAGKWNAQFPGSTFLSFLFHANTQ